jgi:hypothetical protein
MSNVLFKPKPSAPIQNFKLLNVQIFKIFKSPGPEEAQELEGRDPAGALHAVAGHRTGYRYIHGSPVGV